jgi:Spy/CpxP family protein refolding chaperone
VKSLKSTLAVLTAGLALSAGVVMAQDEAAPPSGPQKHAMHGHFMGGGPEFGMFLHQLNLTEDQKAQTKQIFENHKADMRGLMQKEGAAHLQMLQLITQGNFTEEKAAMLAANESQVHAQLEIAHAKIAAEIYQLLNSDQKAKVSELIAQHQQRMNERLDKQQQSAPPSE